jgi:peptidoglycan/xylan/chitin deacetylase (PgdA/CDA1 family)
LKKPLVAYGGRALVNHTEDCIPVLVDFNWPGKAGFGICLTHDVDRVRKTRFHSVYYLLKERRRHHIFTLLKERGTYWNFDKVMEMESKYGVRSTIFFLNEQDLFRDRPLLSLMKPQEWVLYYSSYRVSDPATRNVIMQLDGDRWEIGLHASYESSENKSLLGKEKRELERTLGKRIVGVRQHYLRLRGPETWEMHKELGFQYDSSYGHRGPVHVVDRWIRPFYPIDARFLVIPITIMDTYLFRRCPSLDFAWEKCRGLLRLAQKNHGVVTVIWHIERFNECEFPGYSKVYEKILLEGKRMGAWMGPARDVYELAERTVKGGQV